MSQPAFKGLIAWTGKYMRRKTQFFSLIFFIFFIQTVLTSTAFATTRIMPLGDSITEGYIDGTIDPDERVGYRKQLYTDLIDQDYDVNFVGSLPFTPPADPGFDCEHEGHAGIMANLIASDVYSYLVDHPADIVLLHIGTNDINVGDDAAGVRDEIILILNEIDRYELDYSTEVMVILALIINRDDAPSPESTRITALNGLLQSLVNNRTTIGDQIRAADHENALNYIDDMANTLHPNMTGYHKMADVWFDSLVQILPDPDPPNKRSSSSSSGCFIGVAAY